MNRTVSSRLVALIAACVIVLAACGDDASDEEGGADNTSTTEAPPATEPPPSTEASDDPDELAVTTPPAAEIDRTGEVIKVGYVNNEGGAVSLPEFRIGGETAIDHINADGGINGAEIEVVNCNADSSPEGSINCANQMIEAGVVMVYVGIDLGSDAALPLYEEAGILQVSSNSWGPQQLASDNTIILHAGQGPYAVGPAKLFSEMGLSKIGLISEFPAGEDPFIARSDDVFAKFGLETEFASATPDIAAAVATLQAAGVEAIFAAQTQEVTCIGIVQAVKASTFDGPLMAGSCSLFISLMGEAAEGVYTQSDIVFFDGYDSTTPDVQAHLDLYVELMTAADAESMINGFAVAPHAAWMEIRPILEAIEGEITSDSVKDGFLNAGTTPGWFGPPLNCGAAPWPDEPSTCVASISIWQAAPGDDGPKRVLVEDFFDAFAAIPD
jgi:branched-chain amino acid transport system substrate-binding protein